MNKRDFVMSVLEGESHSVGVPAAFFLHFDPFFHSGQAAVDKHLEFFNFTGMDFVKIQYERKFPCLPQIQRPADWVKMPFYGLDFYAEPLAVVKGLVQAAKKDALVILTLYSPFMCAGHTSNLELLSLHIHEDPQMVQRGMEIITASLMGFVKECIRLGLDGFYTSTQGGEVGRLDDPALFDACVRPYDLALMEEINRTCSFNILHVCDYNLPYCDFSLFLDYPGHVVNAGLNLTGGKTTAQEVSRLFGRPFMGGLDRLGVIATGTSKEVQRAAADVLRAAPERFILGADCTVPAGTSWDNLRVAIDMAHQWRG